MKVKEIFTKKTRTASVTGATVPDERYYGCYDVVGFDPNSNSVFVIHEGNHFFVNGVQYATAWDATKWLFRTENDEVVDFIKED